MMEINCRTQNNQEKAIERSMMELNYRVRGDGDQCNAMEMSCRGSRNGDKM